MIVPDTGATTWVRDSTWRAAARRSPRSDICASVSRNSFATRVIRELRSSLILSRVSPMACSTRAVRARFLARAPAISAILRFSARRRVLPS